MAAHPGETRGPPELPGVALAVLSPAAALAAQWLSWAPLARLLLTEDLVVGLRNDGSAWNTCKPSFGCCQATVLGVQCIYTRFPLIFLVTVLGCCVDELSLCMQEQILPK